MKIFRILNRKLENFITRNLISYFVMWKTGGVVVSGPFKGMKYVRESVGSRFLPKILGTYEMELVPVLNKIFRESFDVIIDVGAAEGYYAVGMAMRNPLAKIIAFETQKEGRDSMLEMASLNGVSDRLEVLGLCDAKSLSEATSGGGKRLVIMDIEGAEIDLLDNSIIPGLNSCHILVEIHDCVSEGIGDRISRRFKDTHKMTEVWERERRPDDFPIPLSRISAYFFRKYLILNSMDEARHDRLAPVQSEKMRWFYFEPR